MQPFVQTDIPDEYKTVEAYMNTFGAGRAEATHMRDLMMKEKFYINDKYQVNTSVVQSVLGEILHLSVKRLDKEPIHDWRDMQEIKNIFAGPECEGMEIYPAESRLVDCANQYHIWAFTSPDTRIPIGWQTRLVASEIQAASVGAKQRARY